MKKSLLALLAIGAAVTMTLGLAACGGGNTHTVTFMDGDTVLKTEEVEDGATVEEYTPTKDGGYEFVDWFATPSKNHEYDFSTPITDDVTIYAGFTLFKDDTREFYVLGSGTSELLFTSDWGAVITDAHKMTKADGKNEYSITMDLKEGDQFQFALDSEWSNKRGYGYLDTLTMADGTEVFSGEGSPYDDSAKGSNIVCEYSGNYTLTLHTYPNEDYYNTAGEGYTEDRKEIYNIGTYDKITWVRNGDVINDTVTITDFYIKGAGTTNWADMYNSNTQMVNNGGTYTMSVYLKEDDQFMFTSRVTKIEDGETTYSTGSEYIKAENLDEASAAYVGGETGNMTALASGTYTFTYDSDAKTLSVAFDATAVPAAYDYYIDGTFDGNNYGDFITSPDEFKMTETAEGSGVYTISQVTLTEGAELLIRSYLEGETADWNHTHIDYQYANMAANPAFSAASETNNNILVLTEGVYDITFDSYSKIITITAYTDSADTLDIYIKGSGVNGWNHNFSADYRFTLSEDETSYELTVTFTANDDFGIEVFNKGVTEGNGAFKKTGAIGTAGNANSLFVPEGGGDVNFVCSVAGTYRIVYNISADTVDFYTVTE